MLKQGDVLFHCFLITILTLQGNYPDIKEFQIISKLKTWFTRNSYEMRAIYFLEDHSFGGRLSVEGMLGMNGVLQVLKMFCHKEQLLDPPNKEDTMFPSEMI
jgi:hypothetical protein